MGNLKQFNSEQIRIVNNAVSMAEELVSNYYKMSANQWLHRRYDVKTLATLHPDEIVHGPFAQVIRYEGHRKNNYLGSSYYDFYKICFQDHSILKIITESPQIKLLPFSLYIITHELIHIVRFSKFLQNFNASEEEKLNEEARVHKYTHDILKVVGIMGMKAVLVFYSKWRCPIEGLGNSPEK